MPEVYNSSTANTDDSVNGKKSSRPTRSSLVREHQSSSKVLRSFIVHPSNVRLGVQEGDEKVLLLLRRHFITNWSWIVIVILMALVPVLISLIPAIDWLPARFATSTTLLWYLLTLGITLNGFLSWYYNVYIITDERIVDVDFLNLLYSNVSTAKIDNIEDVTVQMAGTLRSLLNFGTVFIQTAAEKTEFEFEDVPRPQEVAKLLNEMILEEEQEKLEGRAK